MTFLELSTYRMPAADLGEENPLAPLRPYGNPTWIEKMRSKVECPDQGRENIFLPYRIQDGYNRVRQPRDFRVAVLENDFLRATFLLEMGGRLWSLFDKQANRELLYVNPVFQPANLAIRSAWFTGGVEWNCGIFGHSVLTCEPVFAARVTGPDGEPILRIYEWERARQIPIQIDFRLCQNAPFLISQVRLVNPHDYFVPMYWWSNIAIPEKVGTRVLAPAESAQRHNYSGELVTTGVPIVEGIDATYTKDVPTATDLYFDIPTSRRPWIAAVDADGAGFVHTSSDRLRGRKLFNWGSSAGGQRWQGFLSSPGQAYLEIQGGLAKTQTEYLHMPPKSTWEWVEAFGPINVDAADAHGDWSHAWRATERALASRLPEAALANEWKSLASSAAREPDAILHYGRGWGALERLRKVAARESSPAQNGLPFPDDSITKSEMPWRTLLETGALPYANPSDDPEALMVQIQWQELLETAVRAGRGDHWRSWYHLGVMRHRRGDLAGARAAWERSVALEPSAWAYRNLAQIDLDEGDVDEGCSLMMQAVRLAPACAPLVREFCEFLLDQDRPQQALAVLKQAAPGIWSHGRIRLCKVRASLALGDTMEAESFYNDRVIVDDIREGEVSVTDIWYQWQALRRAKEIGESPSRALLAQVKEELSPPFEYEFRLYEPPGCAAACSPEGS